MNLPKIEPAKLIKRLNVSRFLPKMSRSAELPGTVSYVGESYEETTRPPVSLHVLDYNETDFAEKQIKTVAESIPFKESPTVTWLDVYGVHDVGVIEEVGRIFDIHPLVLEDIANTTQRPKLEEYDNYLFLVLKMAGFQEENQQVTVEQVSLLVGKDYVVSFQEKRAPLLDALKDRIRNSKGRVRRLGSDYLAYCILDAIVDHYFFVLERLGEKIEQVEEQLLSDSASVSITTVYRLKQELVFFRKSIWPVREVIAGFLKSEHDLLNDSTLVFMRDVSDHSLHVLETVETLRDMTSGMLDLHLSAASNKMNEVMKVLTIFAAIFIPLTFIVGVYGMNFDNMPELHMENGYFIVWGLMVAAVGGMLYYFRKQKWL